MMIQHLNSIIQIETSLSPEELLDVCQSIENRLGRVREMKWGPRVIDVDILLYEDQNLITDRLIIPHPHMINRDFVMIPLSEISPQLVIKGKTAIEWAHGRSKRNESSRFTTNLFKPRLPNSL